MGFFVVAALLVVGCGLKANPVPKATEVSQPRTEQKLQVTADGHAIVLAWQLQNPDGRTSYMNIERSQLGTTGNICQDCPRTFERIGQLPVLSAKSEKDTYRYTDSLVARGRIYSYRLKLCDEAGSCRESQTVEIDFK